MEYNGGFVPDGMNGFERNVKRIMGCMVTIILMILSSPLFSICYSAVKNEDGGPAIFRQERIECFGHSLYVYKFRSMRLDVEKHDPALYVGDKDDHLIKIGKFLHEYHLDGLPQLWNVFCGDTAFIGLRPERQFLINQIMKEDPRYCFLFQIRSGVTSCTMLYNGYIDTLERMVRRLRYDLFCLEHRPWGLDFKIFFMTFMNIVFGKKF